MSEKGNRKDNYIAFTRKWREVRKQWKTELQIIWSAVILVISGIINWRLTFISENAIMIPFVSIYSLLMLVLEIWLLGEIRNDIKSRKGLYNILWKKPGEITAYDILDRRSDPARGFQEAIYFSDSPEIQMFNDVIDKTFEVVSNNARKFQGVLLTGMPLSGKSRMIYHWLKTKIGEKIKILRLREILPEINPDINLIPRILSFRKKKVIIIDNLHTYVLNPHFKELFTQIINFKAVIIATSRSSFEFKKVKDELKECDYLNSLKELQIKNIKEVSGLYQKFERFIKENLSNDFSKSYFDGNVGSLFLDLDEITKRYENLCESIEKISSFFKAIKISYAFGLYVGESRFHIDIIKTIFEQKYYQNIAIGKGEYDTIFKKTCEQEIASGKTESHLFIEPVYVERIFDQERDLSTIIIEDFNLLFKLFSDNIDILNIIGVQLTSFQETLPSDFEPIKKSILCFERINSIDPNNPKVFYNLGVAYDKMGEFDTAIEKYEKALEIEPDVPQILNNLGTAYGEKGELDIAIEKHEKALKLQPDYHKALFNLGVIYDKMGKLDVAIEKYEKALEIQPNFHEALTNLGLIYAKRGKFDTAKYLFEKALEIQSDNYIYLNNLGSIYISIDKIDAAKKIFESMIIMYPNYANGYLHLARINSLQNNKKEALNFLQKALELNPKLKEYRDDPTFVNIRDTDEFMNLMK